MSELKLPVEIEKWLRSFNQRYGRPPRVLHIGNIANNAYNNAKLLIRAGLDCDVICHDYYHIMGCPEWEDADFEGPIEDQFLPDWGRVDLNGFQRQRWFAQGPFEDCVRYLMTRRTGDEKGSAWLWQVLCDSHPAKVARAAKTLAEADRPQATTTASMWLALKHRLGALLVGAYRPPWGQKLVSLRRWKFPLGALIFYPARIAHDLSVFLLLFCLAPVMFPLKLVKVGNRWIRNSPQRRAARSVQYWRHRFLERAQALVVMFRRQFPDRPDQLSLLDLEPLHSRFSLWTGLFQHYDIVQAYSTDPIYPLLAGKPYFAFEHGTLREIPAHETSQGRCTALSYSEAAHVFVTNSDCVDAAKRLVGERFTFINHPYDEDHGENLSGWQELRCRLMGELDADFLFFFPTRHDWVDGTGYADKANDVFLRAFCQLRKNGHRVGLICCRWGANVEHSQAMIAQQGFTKHVLWFEPMGIVRFEKTAKAAHVVVDQFKLGAFGGILFKAMSLGVPMCTFLDEDEMVRQFGEMPPVINCRTEDAVIEAMTPLIRNRDALGELSTAGRRWIKQHHACANTVIAQLSAYMQFLKLPS